MASAIDKGVTAYTHGTPNGLKVNIALEELKIPYKAVAVDLHEKHEHKSEWFLKINPNGRIPAIVDHDNGDYKVWESGAILMYLAEKAGGLYPQDFNKRHEVNQWLFFQMAGVGPMQGQANWFAKYAPEKIEYAVKRYTDETRRLYSVLEGRLADNEWLAAGEYTIADIATFCWVVLAPLIGIKLTEFPNLKTWHDKIWARPAVQAGCSIPEGTLERVQGIMNV